MMDASVRVMPADWLADQDAIKRIRRRVFIVEQGVPEAEEWDDEDARSQHVLAVSANRDVVATGRLQPDAKITRMAVLPAWRGQGVGAAVLESLLEIASDQGMDRIWLHAQVSASGFYQRYGFVNEGEPFDEAGISHIVMRQHMR